MRRRCGLNANDSTIQHSLNESDLNNYMSSFFTSSFSLFQVVLTLASGMECEIIVCIDSLTD